MNVNKVQLANGETIIDISDSTVTPETLAEGVTAHDASGQKITGKMIPGGGSSVQSDWNQTDSSAADFIKNKPFYDGYNAVKIDGEITLTVRGEAELPTIGLVAGNLYTVRYGGNVYTVTAVDLEMKGMPGYAAIGNFTNLGLTDGADLPFFYTDMPSMGYFCDFTETVSTNVALAIVEGDRIGDTVTKDDEMITYMEYVGVSEYAPTDEDLAKGYEITFLTNGVECTANSSVITKLDSEDGNYFLGHDDDLILLVCTNDGLGLQPGVYFIDSTRAENPNDNVITQSFTIYNSTVFAKKIEGKQMDKKFLPNEIALISPSGKKFNITVDDNGTLTATEVTE